MTNSALLGPWIRRFLLEHLVAERNLAVNTQKSYRDMLTLLLPFVASKIRKPIDRLTIDEVEVDVELRLDPQGSGLFELIWTISSCPPNT